MVSILGGLSAVMILSNRDNLQIDLDNADFNISVNITTFQIENINFSLPFKVNNTGYFDIENLELELDLYLNYSSIAAGNNTVAIKILNKTQALGDIPRGEIGDFVFFGDNSSFNYLAFPPMSDINPFRLPHILEFYANITVSLDYSLGLHSLAITLENYFIEGFP
ncbi:MAG: hypothetical protein ACFFAI_00190 [Promethearchaeota archaeon]